MKWNSETTEKLTKNEKKLIDFIFQNISNLKIKVTFESKGRR